MIENYKNLLFAIKNTDFDYKKTKKLIIVYDTENFDIPIGIFKNIRNCAVFFKTEMKSISQNVTRKNLKSGRFKIERINYEL